MIKRIVLKPRTPFSSLFTSDQIWGQFVWALSDMYGEEKATKAVRFYSDGKAPVLFSAAMIDGYLVKPQYVNALADFSNETEKSNKKCRWLGYDDFSCLQEDCMYLKGRKLSLDGNSALDDVQEIHVSISGGTLYNVVYKSSQIPLVVYADIINDEWNDILLDVIENHWEVMGLGGDRNVGRGQFDMYLEDLSPVEKKIFDYRNGSGFVSLSESFGKDLVPLFYNVEAYSGFVGRKNERSSVYRKKPVIRYLPGSFFREGKGSVVKSAGDESEIYSYGLAFPVFMSLEKDDD